MASKGLLTKGITLGVNSTGTGSTYTVLPNLQEIPEIGGTPDTVEITTLDDSCKRYLKGLIDFGTLDFTFLYDTDDTNSAYRLLHSLETITTDHPTWQLSFPDGTKFQFGGDVSTKINGVGTNDAITFTASVTLNSAINITVATNG